MAERRHTPVVDDGPETPEPASSNVFEEDTLNRIGEAEVEDLRQVGLGERGHRRIVHEARPTD